MKTAATAISLLLSFSVGGNGNAAQPGKGIVQPIKAVTVPAKVGWVIEPEKADPDAWTFEKVSGSKLLFKGGNSFETNLYQLAYLGQVNVDGNAPFLVYAGRDCDECCANISLYFHSPRNGILPVANGENRFAFPGKVKDIETNAPVFEAAAFFGEVLKGVKGMIWYQKSLLADGTWENSVFLAKIEGGRVINQELKNTPEMKAETLALHKHGKNKEIKGREYSTEP